MNTEQVTAGIPSLTPKKRFKREMLIKTRDLADRAVAEEKRRATEMLQADGAMDVTALKQRLGRPMSAAAFIEKLKKLNPNLIFERAIRVPNRWGIYYPKPVSEFSAHDDKQFLCGMEDNLMPEMTVSHTKTNRVPLGNGEYEDRQEFCGMTRGWRETLLRLMKSGVVTQAQVEKEFQISFGPSSAHWQKFTGLGVQHVI